MERCEYCKSEIKDNADSCPKCGAPVIRITKEEQALKRRKELSQMRNQRSKRDKALFIKIGIGFAIFMIIGAVVSMVSGGEAETQVYEAAKDEIEYQWDVKTMFKEEDAKISKEGSEYVVYGVVYEREANSSYRDSGKRMKVKCTVPYKKDKAGRAICELDE
ncbi:putative membrane protein YvbJ [Breznakia sp. PF5-3]|uniref:hypothetical protein n=1 Tax=unclassified Breznakia TaxID=2623764 RepID=UPI00240746A7|nr:MULTISPECIES: hypothetical protein [unclassified Breznakia]MDL2276555.1 hypothetical protein [Breznakia sp. OttesenSCG-928-G09]MDF9825540.1 putative membrane protein YvbJ [Breznakia sp. PM6-1]MDF9836416.1 putative membrane protein YvbJ [Breznakia sp. PF5-3]MDF9838194.1 putative membrane protein YvbJ [Breznakia sp. PFB2-8]MDF9860213.1 putative membrane protein YvbJ [Breznakia sp. PH5-24]